MSATVAVASPVGEVLILAINKCFPSGTNPRKLFPEEYINELADSIRKLDLINPVIVRSAYATAEDVVRARKAGGKPQFGPGDEAYEVVAGGCRYRACIVAGKDTISAIARDIPDSDVVEFQIVENLRRKDLEPMEEAEGYKQLMDMGKSQEEIAKRIGGMSPSYISSRVKLCSLVEDGKELLRRKLISPGHAILIARLPSDEDQWRGLRWIFDTFGHYAELAIVDLAEKTIAAETTNGGASRSEKALRQWIKENYNLDLKKAPWKLDDPDLLPEAGPCTTCPFRSGSDLNLFGDISSGDNECLKPACYKEKQNRHIKIEQDNAKEIGKPLLPISIKESEEVPQLGQKVLKYGQWLDTHKGDCPDTVEAILMDGDQRGNTVWVCRNIHCKKHKRAFQGQRPSQTGTSFAPSGFDTSKQTPAQTISNAREENQKREDARVAEQGRREQIALAVVKETRLTDQLLKAAAKCLVREQAGNEAWKMLLDSFLPAGVKLSDLRVSQIEFAKVIAAALLCRHVHPFHTAENGKDDFEEIIKSIGYTVNESALADKSESAKVPAPKKQQAVKSKQPTPKPKATKKAKAAKAGKK